MPSSLRTAALAILAAACAAFGAQAQPPGGPVQATVHWRCTIGADDSFNVHCFVQPHIDPLPPLPTFRVPCTSSLKKAPGRTEFQRGVLTQDPSGNWSVRVTGEQGSGILRSMSEANCFIILPEAQGNVTIGALVEVQVMEGVV